MKSKTKFKQLLLLLLVFTFSAAIAFGQNCGDINADGSTDIIDALLVAQCYVGLTSCPSADIGDVNCDGSIDIIDGLLIAQLYVGLISTLSCCDTPTDPPPTDPPGEDVTLEMQAEDAAWDDAAVESDHAGYTGSGYVNTENAAGQWIEWTIDVDRDCNAVCVFTYATSGSGRPMDLSVNNNTQASLSFGDTGAWTNWETDTGEIILSNGSNAIRLTATSSGGAPNMDKMVITIKGGGVVTPTPTPTPPPTPTPCTGPNCFEIKFDTGDTGVARQWHQVIVTFWGPTTSEDANPSPFYDYRLDVIFRNGGREIIVPGFFAADGNAAETSATSGDRWRVHFVPDAVGEWSFEASFRHGTNVSVDDNRLAGEPMDPNGITGSFTVLPSDKTGRDHRYQGTLEYVGEHYPRYKGTGEYFIMEGSQSPENFLAYTDFDGTRDNGGSGPNTSDGLHHYEPHVKDWEEGDPTWKGGKGKGIIGAVNYMASEHMNTLYAIPFTSGGDGRDTWPWTGPKEYSSFDVSKLAQWEIVLSHMDTKGMQLWVITQEEEEEQWLGKMTPQRKLYYRELISRFSHHHALMWDLDEEMDYHSFYSNVNDIKDICEYFKKIDPYKHPITYVQWKAEFLEDRNMPGYERLLGYENFDGTGLQQNYNNTNRYTKMWVDASAQAGHKWLVGIIETNPNTVGVVPDSVDFWHDKERKHAIWGNLMAGGSGTVFFFGYRYEHSDISLEDFRSRDHFWDMLHYAHKFFTENLPFWQMKHQDNLTPGSNDYVYAKQGDIYVVYLREGGSPTLNLSNAPGTFTVRWYDPRNGGALQTSNVTTVSGGSSRSLGNPPNETSKDWAVLVQREGFIFE